MQKKEVQNYYLKFTDAVEVIYAAYKEPEKDWVPCTTEEAQEIIKLRGEQCMIYKQAKERYEINKKQSRKTIAKA